MECCHVRSESIEILLLMPLKLNGQNIYYHLWLSNEREQGDNMLVRKGKKKEDKIQYCNSDCNATSRENFMIFKRVLVELY